MLRTEALERIRVILQDVFGVDPQDVTEDTTYQDVPDWDSMNHIIMIATIEDELGVHFELDDYLDLKSVRKLLDYIEERC